MSLVSLTVHNSSLNQDLRGEVSRIIIYLFVLHFWRHLVVKVHITCSLLTLYNAVLTVS